MNSGAAKIILTLAIFAATLPGFSAPPKAKTSSPVQQATEARVDLQASNGDLDNGLVVAGTANFNRMNWLAKSDQSKSYQINVPVNPNSWVKTTISFVPQKTGNVSITLRGPYLLNDKKEAVKKEVFFDNFLIEGASIPNLSFEEFEGSKIVSWTGAGIAQSNQKSVKATHGTHFAQVWHDGALGMNIVVTAKKKVTITFDSQALKVKP